jgi:hypothetical protein
MRHETDATALCGHTEHPYDEGATYHVQPGRTEVVKMGLFGRDGSFEVENHGSRPGLFRVDHHGEITPLSVGVVINNHASRGN